MITESEKAVGLKLPRQFTNIDLADLIEYVRIADELSELHSASEDKMYWDGWHDCMASLFGDLTHQPTYTRKVELARTFENFRMEDRLERMSDEIKSRDLGY